MENKENVELPQTIVLTPAVTGVGYYTLFSAQFLQKFCLEVRNQRLSPYLKGRKMI